MSTVDRSIRPSLDEYAEYFGTYIHRVPNGDIVEIMKGQIAEFGSVLGGISEEDSSVLHAPYTWTIKQVVGHLIDVERVFSYRALRFASGDDRPIIGMEQDSWVDNTDYETPTLEALANELKILRQGNLCFFERIKSEAWDKRGAVDGNEMSVRAVSYCLVGHIIHHLEIVKARVA